MIWCSSASRSTKHERLDSSSPRWHLKRGRDNVIHGSSVLIFLHMSREEEWGSFNVWISPLCTLDQLLLTSCLYPFSIHSHSPTPLSFLARPPRIHFQQRMFYVLSGDVFDASIGGCERTQNDVGTHCQHLDWALCFTSPQTPIISRVSVLVSIPIVTLLR
jgi:hypothetical protein